MQGCYWRRDPITAHCRAALATTYTAGTVTDRVVELANTAGGGGLPETAAFVSVHRMLARPQPVSDAGTATFKVVSTFSAVRFRLAPLVAAFTVVLLICCSVQPLLPV